MLKKIIGAVLLAPLLALAQSYPSPTFNNVTSQGTATLNNAVVSGTFTATGKVGLASLASQAANTVVANATSSGASPTAISVPSCSTPSSALSWISGTGLSCNASINAATLGGATFAAPGAIGGATPGAATFTNLTTTGTTSLGAVPTIGAATFFPTVPTNAALRALSTATTSTVTRLGFYASGDAPPLVYTASGSACALSAGNGDNGSQVKSADSKCWIANFSGRADARQWGVKPDAGTTDNSTTMANAAAWVAASPLTNKLVFSSGTYGYSVSPNWGITNAEISAEGKVTFLYSGTGNALILDGGASTGGIYNESFGWGTRFIVQGSASSQNGVFARSILQGSKIGVQVNGAGTSYSGVEVDFCVTALFDVVVSNNAAGGTFSSKPANGLKLTNRGAGELSSYCTFINPVIEGVAGSGALLDQAQGNIFIGGTIEGNSSVGMNLTANAIKNKVFGTDFEANTNHDVYCQGNYNEFYGINSQLQVTFDSTAKLNKVIGGTFQTIFLNTSTVNNLISGVMYNQLNSTGTINDVPNKNRRRDNNNYATSNVENTPLATSGITVTASPFTYTNTTSNEQTVAIIGGTVSAMSLTHGGTATSGIPTNNMYNLSPGDSIQVTYSAAPTMNLLTR